IRRRHAHPSSLALSKVLGPFRVDRATSRRGDDDGRYLAIATRRVVEFGCHVRRAPSACNCRRLKSTTPSNNQSPAALDSLSVTSRCNETTWRWHVNGRPQARDWGSSQRVECCVTVATLHDQSHRAWLLSVVS